MPQGPPELHERFGDDETAWELLKKAGGWQMTKGMFWHSNDREISQDEKDAANYLCIEWDWSWVENDPRK